jgi:hypothetical protein
MSALRERVFYAVLDLFYPPHCVVCSAPFREGERAFLCAAAAALSLKGSISAHSAPQQARESLSRYAHSGGTKSAETLIMC